MRRIFMGLLAGLFLTGAADGEERWDLSKFREESDCGPHLDVFLDHFEPAINGESVPEGVGDLEAALYVTLGQNVFDCPGLQFLAAMAIGDGEIHAALRDLGLPVPFDPDRARAAFRRLAVYDAKTEEDFFDEPTEFLWHLGFAAPGGVEEARIWAASLEGMTAAALLAEARRHQAQDDDLAKYLERMAALKGSPEAAILVARRALADPNFGFDLLLVAYLLRAIEAGAADLEPAADRILRQMYDRERHRQVVRDYVASDDFALDSKILWR